MLAHTTGRLAGTGAPGIGAVAEHHRHRFRHHLHCRLQRRGAHRQHHVHLLAGELLHHQSGVGQFAGGVLLEEGDGLAIPVSGGGQGFLEALAGEVRRRRIHHLQHADHRPLAGLAASQPATGRQQQRTPQSGTGQGDKLTTPQAHGVSADGGGTVGSSGTVPLP